MTKREAKHLVALGNRYKKYNISIMLHVPSAEYDKIRAANVPGLIEKDSASSGKSLRTDESCSLVMFRKGAVI